VPIIAVDQSGAARYIPYKPDAQTGIGWANRRNPAALRRHAERPVPPGPIGREQAVSARQRLADVEAQIAAAAEEAGRAAADITLIAVSKTHGAAAIEPVLAAGHRHFGENRVQEAQSKWPALKAAWPDATLHLIGGLQSNKVADAVALFDIIHTVDRPKLARRLAAEMQKQDRHLPCFVQVNTGKEAQKGGVPPGEATAFVAACRDEFGLEVAGLMCIPPLEDEPAPHFAFLSKLAAEAGVAGLSMGMSADFGTAIRLGATHVRVGTAIFGPRNT
jgi:pyridoxal phosphate enzyme (YggS family)